MAAPSARTLPAGHVLGRYVVVSRIGAGGMAELYLGRVDGPPRFAKPVALKLLHPHLAEDPQFSRMFVTEARIAATLSHANLVAVLDVDIEGPDSYLVLEYVHGRDLRQVLAAGGKMPLGLAVRVVIDVARGLHHAHAEALSEGGRPLGLVHRDVSPANVLVSFHGEVKLGDFGIAKASAHTVQTATGALKGKFGYMSPEQYLQEELDARSDVYSLGIVLYEATTGRRAFRGEAATIMNRVLDGNYVPPEQVVDDYPPALAAIVDHALALEVDDRFSSAADFADALEDLAADLGLDTRRESLATYVRGLFDDPPMPDLDVAARRPELAVVDTAVTAVGDPAATRATRPWALLVLLAIGIGVGGFAGWRMARSGAEAIAADDPPATPTATPEPSPDFGDDAGVVAPEPEPAAAAVAPPPDPPAPTVESDAPADDKPAARATRRRRRPPERKTEAKSDATPRAGMFPRGM